MRRMPDWLYVRVERAYLAEKRQRNRELREKVDARYCAFRAFAAEQLKAHDAGTCGGKAAGCPYVSRASSGSTRGDFLTGKGMTVPRHALH